ncbi:peptidase inhibitor family I36 protein [Nonomuraea sp. 3N208]|uniref:peptidase inhibitor family I36 protein n=1 Tax=Nonomuraea sp. 3N208 TaxID=3457421 RepID=UPI003FCFBFD9
MAKRGLATTLALLAVFLLPEAAHAQEPPDAEDVTAQFVYSTPISSGYASCPDGWFCAWSQPNAGGYGTAYANDLCRIRLNFTDKYNDWIDSIRNRLPNNTWVHVQNWNGQTWDDLWVSGPNNWGNLPYEARNRADGLYFNC